MAKPVCGLNSGKVTITCSYRNQLKHDIYRSPWREKSKSNIGCYFTFWAHIVITEHISEPDRTRRRSGRRGLSFEVKTYRSNAYDLTFLYRFDVMR